MSATDLLALLNQEGQIEVASGLLMHVRITDAKTAYGNTRVLIAPAIVGSGFGAAWVDLSRVKLPVVKSKGKR